MSQALAPRFTAPRLQLHVTKADIEKGCRNNASQCMEAQAILRHFPEAQFIRCDTREISFSLPSIQRRRRYFQTPVSAKNVVKFDRGEEIKPFKLDLTNGIEIPMGWKAKHPGSTRKHKIYKKTGKKAVRYSKHRHFGACNISDAEAEVATS